MNNRSALGCKSPTDCERRPN